MAPAAPVPVPPVRMATWKLAIIWFLAGAVFLLVLLIILANTLPPMPCPKEQCEPAPGPATPSA